MEAELLAAIHANLDDDAPRLVYGDWLIERGDVRGEILARQLRDPACDLSELLARLPRPAWAADWPPAFERGFAAKLVVTGAPVLLENVAEIRAQHPLASIELADRAPVVIRGDLLATIVSEKDRILSFVTNTTAIVVNETGKRLVEYATSQLDTLAGPDGELIVDVRFSEDGRSLEVQLDNWYDKKYWETVTIPP